MQFKKFYEAIEKREMGDVEFATFEDGLREMLLNDRVYESASKRAWVTI
jgi:hypothetical protein